MSERRSSVRDVAALLVCILVPVAVGVVSGVATAEGVTTWYRDIAKPWFTPPNAVFGPVWTVLYLMMGVASFLVWRAGGRDARTALAWFAVQLGLNGLWSVTFFGLQRPGLALLDLVGMLACILVTIRLFGRFSRVAAGLMLPYAAWVTFAGILNFAIWRLNA